MNRSLRKRSLALGAVAAALLPWAAVWFSTPQARTDWECMTAIEFAAHGNDRVVRAWGTMAADYRPDGTGAARFFGEFRDGAAAPLRVHRAMAFDYQSVGSFVRVHTTHSARQMNDDTPDAQVYRYILPGFQTGHTDYFQAMRMGHGAGVGVGDQPRFFCAPPHAEPAPRPAA